jgi:hypothetical protein
MLKVSFSSAMKRIRQEIEALAQDEAYWKCHRAPNHRRRACTVSERNNKKQSGGIEWFLMRVSTEIIAPDIAHILQ